MKIITTSLFGNILHRFRRGTVYYVKARELVTIADNTRKFSFLHTQVLTIFLIRTFLGFSFLTDIYIFQ